jgi:hypothetical protein
MTRFDIPRISCMSFRLGMSLRLLACGLLFTVATSARAARSFSDVPESHPAFAAIEALKNANILSGYPDGTFKPDKLVNRAEAVKIITAPLLSADHIKRATSTVYADVSPDAWYLPYVEWARQAFKIIDGPPRKTAFEGERPVILAEFLKMAEIANGVDPLSAYGNITLPLSNDVTNAADWYYPYMRYALSSSMLGVDQEGKLNPSHQLTRADTALLLYNLLAYKQKQRTQMLLDASERNMIVILQAWGKGAIDEAEYAAARGLLTAYGAHSSHPDEPATKGAVKVAEAFHALVQGYRAGTSKEYPLAVEKAKQAWILSDQAVAQYPDIRSLADQIKAVAKTVADSARTLMDE